MNKKNIFLAVLIALEVVILGIYTMSFNRQLSTDISQDDLLLFMGQENGYEKGFYCDHSYHNGEMITTEPFYLKKGIYNISYTCDTNNQYQDGIKDVYSEIESVDDFAKHKGADNVDFDVIGIEENPGSKNHVAYVKRSGNFRVNFKVESDGDFLMVGDIHIEYLRGKTILHEFTIMLFWFLLLDIVLGLYLFRKDKTAAWIKENATVTALLAGLVALSSYPLVHKGLFFGDDIGYHLTRFVAIAEGLRSGTFPVKIHPVWSNGYGYADGVGYGSLFLYPSAVLIALGFSLGFAYKFYCLMMNTIAVVVAYKCFKSITKKKHLGIVGAALYSLMGFHLHSVYSGALVGEFAAYAFLPLAALGMWDIYTENEEFGGYKGVIEMAVGIEMTIETQVHSTLILVLVIPVVCLIFFRKTFSKKIFFNLLKTLGLVIILGLHFMIPVVDYLINVPMYMGGKSYILWSNSTLPEYMFMNYPDPSGYGGGWAALGFSSLIALFICAAVLGKGYLGKNQKAVLKLLIYTVVLIFMCTKWCPYYGLYLFLPKPIYSALEILQFPWHFLGTISCLVVFLTVMSLSALEDNLAKEGKLMARITAIMVGFVLTAITIGQDLTFYDSLFQVAHTITAYNSSKAYFSGLDEFGIKGSSSGLADAEPEISVPEIEGVSGTMTKRKGTTVYADIANNTEEKVYVKYPLWCYKGYKAKSDSGKIAATMADDCRVQVEVPAGFSGTIKVYFSEPWYWRCSEILSLATAIAVFVFWKKKKIKNEC